MSAPAGASQAILALTAAELRLAARRGENLLVTLVVPAAVLVFFATIGSGVVGGAEDAVSRLLPGTLALAIIATSFVNLGIATAYERHYGVLKRLGGAPLPRGAIVVAKLLAVLVVELLQVALLIVVAAGALGWQPGPGLSPATIALGIAGVALGTAAFAGLALAMAGRLRAEATLAVANGLFVAFLLVGGLIVPAERLPQPLGSVAGVLPAAPLAELLRVALGGAGDVGRSVVVLAAWAVAAVGVAIRAFRWH